MEPLISKLKLRNLLSYDDDGVSLPLRNLNIVVGVNGSGKSNLIEAISLLSASPKELVDVVRDGGGIGDWLWKGSKNPTAEIEAVLRNDLPEAARQLRHSISFTEAAQRFEIVDEFIEDESPRSSLETDPYFFYKFQNNHPVLNVKDGKRQLKREDVDPQQSIIAQRKDPEQYPEITYLGEIYKTILTYREWGFGRYTKPRQPQKTDMRNDYLEEDCANLGLVLNKLRRNAAVKKRILKFLSELYPAVQDFDVSIEGGAVQVFLQESGFEIPATRLSDGTLRYLCLLAILCDPEPPPLICIEEPELGLHPDVIGSVGALLKEASEKTQLIVTTHSDVLVDCFSSSPEDVLVCEKLAGVSNFRRLESDDLEDWLEKYSLGQLWRRGEVGGNRW